MPSYVAILEAGKGSLLLGGVKRHVSSRFSTRDDAHAWLNQAVETNLGAGRVVDRAYTEMRKAKPEIAKAW